MSNIEKIGKHFYRVLRGQKEQAPEDTSKIEEKAAFVRAHRAEIVPLVENPALVDDVTQNPDVQEISLNGLLERYETKILSWKRPDTAPDSRKILLEASQPANVGIVAALIEHLRADSRCGEITLITDNVAGQQLEKTVSMTHVRTDRAPVIADIPDGPYDSALIMDEPKNSAMPFLRESAKGVFGAKRLLYYSPGVPPKGTVDNAFPKFGTQCDLLLTSDELASRMCSDALGVPETKLQVVGSLAIEKIQNEDAESLRSEGREKLHIPESTITAAYLGFPSGDSRTSSDTPRNTSTFLKVAEGVIETARRSPEKKFAFVVRTHPRARAVEPLPDISTRLPSNLNLINGDSVSYDDVVYAADLICCVPSSTEASFAYYRGRAVALCAFSGKGEAGEDALHDYGERGINIFRETGRGTPVVFPNELVDLLNNAYPLDQPKAPPQKMVEHLKNLLVE